MLCKFFAQIVEHLYSPCCLFCYRRMDFVVPGVISIRIGVYQETFAAKQHEHQARNVVIEGLGPTWSYTRTFLTRNLKSAQHTPIILSPVTLNPRLFHLSSGALATDALVASTSPAEVPEASRMPCCTSVCLNVSASVFRLRCRGFGV